MHIHGVCSSSVNILNDNEADCFHIYTHIAGEETNNCLFFCSDKKSGCYGNLCFTETSNVKITIFLAPWTCFQVFFFFFFFFFCFFFLFFLLLLLLLLLLLNERPI